MRSLKDRSRSDGELFITPCALPAFPGGKVIVVPALTGGAGWHAIGPAKCGQGTGAIPAAHIENDNFQVFGLYAHARLGDVRILPKCRLEALAMRSGRPCHIGYMTFK